jgi:hypothetical protein
VADEAREENVAKKKDFSIMRRHGDNGGISFQIPENWDDGSGKIRHVKDGPFKGRVYWTSQKEAQDIARRLEDQGGTRVRYGESDKNMRRPR